VFFFGAIHHAERDTDWDRSGKALFPSSWPRPTGKGCVSQKDGAQAMVEFFATFHACTVVMEACAGAHHIARKLAEFGHQVKLISPQFVRRLVKSN
jgi:hypothetical protein